MYEKLLKTVTTLGSPKILVVGDFILDSYIYGDALRISPEAPVPVLKVVKKEYNCGGAGFVAADIAALGATPICIGVIGDDANGQSLCELLTKAGADISSLLTVPDRPTTSKQRLIGLAQHIHRQQLIRLDEESTDQLSQDQYDQILKSYEDNLNSADIVCLQDYNKGVFSDSLCEQMIKLAKKAKKKVLIDPSSTSDYSKYTGATLITPNRKEASIAAGFEIQTIDDAKRAAQQLKDNLKLDAIVITLDKDGAYLKTNKISQTIPTVARTVYDVSGAGDMVLAALGVALAAECDYESAVTIANLAAGLEIEKFGAATVTVDEIVNEIISENRGKTGKVRTIESLISELNWHRTQGEKIISTNGCFDVLHRGHIEYLNFCKQQGGIVVVGLNSDSSVKANKGPERPVNNQHDRASVLASLECVDYVVIFDENEPSKLLEKIKPDIHVKGQDWENKHVFEKELVEQAGGKVVFAPLVEGKSSTSVIEKLKTLWKKS